MVQYQVTLMCETGAYKPVSTIITVKEKVDLSNIVEKKKIINLGITKICQKRYWTSRDLKKYNYIKAKVREYDKEEIERQKKENYEKLKQEKYACGEWKAPKKKEL